MNQEEQNNWFLWTLECLSHQNQFLVLKILELELTEWSKSFYFLVICKSIFNAVAFELILWEMLQQNIVNIRCFNACFLNSFI